jgi:uncharacterized ion transporter superfamily protein YfcC
MSKQPKTPSEAIIATATFVIMFVLMLGGMLWIVSQVAR